MSRGRPKGSTRGLRLNEEQRLTLKFELNKRFKSMSEVAEAINISTNREAVNTWGIPPDPNQIYFYLRSRPRPLTPSIAKALYELCDRTLNLSFLEEYANSSDIEVNTGLVMMRRKTSFERLEDAKKYANKAIYQTLRNLLDKSYYHAQQDEEQTRLFLGGLESLIKKYTPQPEQVNSENKEDESEKSL